MFESVESGPTLSKREFAKAEAKLREQLLSVQHRLQEAKWPVVVVVGGVEGAGKSEMVALLNEWMDPRHIVTNAYGAPSEEEASRPLNWRYWRDMPAKGRIGLYLSAWYSQPLLQRVKVDENDARFDAAIDDICRFEKTLTDDGALVLKFWLHLDKDQQKKHLRKLEASPTTAWRIAGDAWENWHLYDEFIAATQHMISRTNSPQARWQVVDGADDRSRSIEIGNRLLAALEERLANPPAVPEQPAALPAPKTSVLASVDLKSRLSRNEYKERLAAAQARLNRLQQRANKAGISTILVFEGWDAAGKGGTIRRIIHAVDPRQYRVNPVAAPSKEEHAQHYLWRFWKQLPKAGQLAVFDRSWYGRVLVERVEGFARADEWQRAYSEINDFEKQITGHGTVLCKFWLHISSEEQLARFNDRAEVAHKAWKLTDEDWRNRDRWDDYEHAVHDLVERCSPGNAPWTLVAANQKWTARVQVIETLCERLEARLKLA